MSLILNGSGTITGLSAGGLPDATIVQADLAANVAGNGPAFSAYQAGQTVTTSTVVKATLNTELFDTNNNFDSSTNYRFTPTVAGYYQVNATIATGAASINGGVVLGMFYRNGGQYGSYFTEFLDSNATGLAGSGVQLIQMNGSTDYLEVYIFQSSGANQLITTYFSGFLARAA